MSRVSHSFYLSRNKNRFSLPFLLLRQLPTDDLGVAWRGTKINRLDLGDVVGNMFLDRSKSSSAIYKQVIKISHRDSCRLCRKQKFVTLNWNIFVKTMTEKRLSLRFIDSAPLCVTASRASSQRLEIYARILKNKREVHASPPTDASEGLLQLPAWLVFSVHPPCIH